MNYPNRSPWIDQLQLIRTVNSLTDDKITDIAVIGAGIAGITTAYFLLKNTTKKIILLEASRVAHGASGHNAGQLASYFEKPLTELIKVYGHTLTAQAITAIESAWTILEAIHTEAKLTTPFVSFTGYAGCQDSIEVLQRLENNYLRRQLSLPIQPFFIADDAAVTIPAKYEGLYSLVSKERIFEMLETQNPAFIAAIAEKKGCMNSALFCEELIHYLLATYPNRLELFEDTLVKEIVLGVSNAQAICFEHSVFADKIILCTNGYTHLSFSGTKGQEIDTKFHQMINPIIGFMAAYVEPDTKPPTAISYLPDHTKTSSDAYFYLTRRMIETPEGIQNFVSVGGPEKALGINAAYDPSDLYPTESEQEINTFLQSSYALSPTQISFAYRWHGLMAYTPNWTRLIGPEPLNPTLVYNLGCNGVGILPSLYAGKRIAQIINGEPVPPSIFDPR